MTALIPKPTLIPNHNYTLIPNPNPSLIPNPTLIPNPNYDTIITIMITII